MCDIIIIKQRHLRCKWLVVLAINLPENRYRFDFEFDCSITYREFSFKIQIALARLSIHEVDWIVFDSTCILSSTFTRLPPHLMPYVWLFEFWVTELSIFSAVLLPDTRVVYHILRFHIRCSCLVLSFWSRHCALSLSFCISVLLRVVILCSLLNLLSRSVSRIHAWLLI